MKINLQVGKSSDFELDIFESFCTVPIILEDKMIIGNFIVCLDLVDETFELLPKELKKILEKKGAEGEGINEEFTTDGKLHEDKFLNKIYSYPDTADSFKIEKDEKGYFITDYIDESPILEKEVPVKEEKSRLKLYSGIYLIAEDGDIVYAYDTKLEKLVFLNKYMKVMNIALE